MPWGWECRAKLIKQVPAKPTERKNVGKSTETPGPNYYEPPQIFCGPGFDKIKRAPAYTFGIRAKPITKTILNPKAQVLDVSGFISKGRYKITHGVISPAIPLLTDKIEKPGPAAYKPALSYKRPPAYSIRQAAKPPYLPMDMWTPPPNMYLPYEAGCKKQPAYTLGYAVREQKQYVKPGPGDHDPNFNYVKRKKPEYTIGYPFKRLTSPKIPPPNAYCEKKFMVSKPTIPAPSFGIRHSPFMGKRPVYMKPSNLGLVKND